MYSLFSQAFFFICHVVALGFYSSKIKQTTGQRKNYKTGDLEKGHVEGRKLEKDKKEGGKRQEEELRHRQVEEKRK